MPYELFDVFQQGLIDDARYKAESAKRDSEQNSIRLHQEVQRLNAKIDGLALICEALWELLREQTSLSGELIHEKIREIDLRDGRRDGRMSGNPTTCSSCGRTSHTRNAFCMYCGTAIERPE